MENTNKDTAQDAALQNDWQNAERNESQSADPSNTQNNDFRSAEASGYGTDEDADDSLYATGDEDRANGELEDDNEDKDESEDDGDGDWGSVDPAEDNSPFPDSNDPSGPGSAV